MKYLNLNYDEIFQNKVSNYEVEKQAEEEKNQ